MPRKKILHKNIIPKYNIYRIILANNGKKVKLLTSDKTEQGIMKKFNELLKLNKKNVLFPKKYIVQGHEMFQSDYEIIILKLKDVFDDDVAKVRDESGKFVNYSTNSENWIVIDRAQYDVEENFWVYGYHPSFQRKDFKWIIENFIDSDAKNKLVFKSIRVYLNKVLFEINGKIEMVICKNKSDSIRLYNAIQKECEKKKYKNIAFMGDMDKSKYKNDWIEKITKLTNWSHTKVIRPKTRA